MAVLTIDKSETLNVLNVLISINVRKIRCLVAFINFASRLVIREDRTALELHRKY